MSLEHSPARHGDSAVGKFLQSIGPLDPMVAQLLLTISPLELLRYADMGEAAELSSLSQETLEREYGDWIKSLSKRRKGMRVLHALLAGDLARTA